MGGLGNRKDTIKRETRLCETHGFTDYACYRYGNPPHDYWHCMKCDAKRNKDYRNSVKAGADRSRKSPVEPKRGDICPICSNEKPLTGICDDCD